MTFSTGLASARSLAAVAAVLLAGAATAGFAQSPAPSALQEGSDYRPINPPQPTMTDEGVEVAEVFQYSCVHCYSFEPHLDQWEAEKADYVNFVRLPASWNELSQLHARAYYTAQALDKLEEMHSAFFNEIHVEGNLLDTEGKLADFFARFGVDEETFTQTFNSFAVHTRVQRADELIRRYRVMATPNIVVAGKYVTDGSMAGSYDRWFEIIDTLAAQEHEQSE